MTEEDSKGGAKREEANKWQMYHKKHTHESACIAEGA